MNIVDAIQKRKSIRDFKDDRVPKETIRDILEVAGRTPSAMNGQPWEFTVIAGDVLDKVKGGFIEKFRAGKKAYPERTFAGWPRESVYRGRQVDLAKGLFKLMDITRDDAEKRMEWVERGYGFFNAPVVVVICVDRMLKEGTPIFDIGGVTQTICLAAMEHGIGTCIAEQGVSYPDVLREHCNIPDNKQIVISIALGYANMDFPANQLEVQREPVDMTTKWCGL